MTLRTPLRARSLRALAGAGLMALGLGAPAAAWTTQAGGGSVLIQQIDQGWRLELRCQRSTPGALGFVIVGPTAGSLQGVTSVEVGAELPGGERRSDTIAVTSNGQVATANWRVNDRILDIFAQGLTMRVTLQPGGQSLVTNMTGTYAARSAIRSECGF